MARTATLPAPWVAVQAWEAKSGEATGRMANLAVESYSG
jgi:hypothetical protein